jgi:hypothetical protein
MQGTICIFVVLGLVLSVMPASAEWQKSADLSLSLNQTSYSSSWAGGEAGALTWNFTGNLAAEKALSAAFNWKNTLDLSYGQTHTESMDDAGDRHWQKPQESADRILFESLLRATLGSFADPYAAITFDSHFYDRSVPDEHFVPGVPKPKRYISPILLTESVGVGRMFAKDEQGELFSRLGPAVRQHISNKVIGLNAQGSAYETETSTVTDGGIEWVTDFSRTFAEGDVKYKSKLRVFQALFNSEKDDLAGTAEEDYWKTPDMAWENTLSASVSKHVQVSLFLELLYDKEIDLRGRFREVLGLGLAYKLF